MPALVSDEMIDTIAACGQSGEEVAAKVADRYGSLVDRVTIHAGERFDLDAWEPVVRAFTGSAE
jgi:hypothetical protein